MLAKGRYTLKVMVSDDLVDIKQACLAYEGNIAGSQS